MKASQVIDLIKQNRGTHEFIPTGFPILDRNLDGGFLRKEMVVIGGSTGAGKSYLAIHLAMQAANAGFKVGYFSLEISNELVVARMIGMKAGIKASHILYGLADEGDIELKKAQTFVVGLSDLFNVNDNIYDLALLEKDMRQEKYEYIVVDFVQNIMGTHADTYERLSFISLHLQRLAKQLNCCVVLLSQLSNEVSRDDIESRVLEFKGSGSIATVADLAFFLAQKKVDPELDLGSPVQEYTLKLAKNRRGPSNKFTELRVRWPGGTFYEQS